MISMSIQVEDTTAKVRHAAADGNATSTRHAAAIVRQVMRRSIKSAPRGQESPEGTPPHTHRGQSLKNAIRYAVEGEEAVIGADAAIIDNIGAIHEHGDKSHPPRPFAAPALQVAKPRIARQWAGSIGR